MQTDWPSLTLEKLISVEFDQTDNEDIPLIVDLIRVGIHSIPIDFQKPIVNTCAKAFFSLNGNCGYVIKQASLRHGKLYCTDGLSEDQPLLNEPKTGPSIYTLKIICGMNLMKYCNNMKTQVSFRLFSHQDDTMSFQTEFCSIPGISGD